jgi:predicted dehydrogenase
MATGFGVIGCGMIANFHAKAIADIPGAKLVACVDAVPASADKFAAGQGCTAYHDLEKFLADPAIDIVTICTPSGLHMEPAVAAAKAGKHVIVEKPLEITLDRCDQIIHACEQAGVTLATIFPARFHAPAVLIKQAIDSGRFGKLALGSAYVKWFRTQEYYDGGKWRGTWKLDGGGALMNQAIHSVDLLTYFMGPVKRISAMTATLAHERIEVEDDAVAALEFASGALGTIEASTAAFPGHLKRIEICGNCGSATMIEEDITFWEFADKTEADAKLLADMAGRTKTGGGAADPSAIGHHGHTQQFQDAMNAIANKTKPQVDGREGRRSVEIILAIYKSAETGQAIDLPLTSDPVLKARENIVKK